MPHFDKPVFDGNQEFTFQGAAELDLTSANDTTIVIPKEVMEAADGGDAVVAVKVIAYVTTTVAAGTTAPVITIEDSDGTDSGLTLTLTDGDAAGDLAIAEIADGAAVTALDLTDKSLKATVTTAAADAVTAAGAAKVLVSVVTVK